MENDTKVLNKSAEQYADKGDKTGTFRLLPIKQCDKECKGQTKNSRNS